MQHLATPHIQPPSLLHVSPHVLVVYKPAGVPFHQSPEQEGLLQLCRRRQALGDLPAGPLFPVHRLDTITSGALVLARDRSTAGLLARSFRQRRVHKYYVALSERRPAKKMGTVAGDMRRGRRGSWLLERGGNDPAITRFLSSAVPLPVAAAGPTGAAGAGVTVAPAGGRPGLRAFLLKPETGRTHQLRVALKALGAPVLGDARYAQADRARGEERGYLHCAALRFAAPGGLVQVVCPPAEGAEFLSPGFRALFEQWLPAVLVANEGPWFPDQKLLRSELLSLDI